MTLTHRLTFARDGPKVTTVTDSKQIPYTFEPGMRVILHESSGVLVRVAGGVISFYDGGRYIQSASRYILADIDHPGTRGLLLEQYREASGYAYACVSHYYDVSEDDPEFDSAPDWFDGPWGVEVNDGGPRRVVGEGESEGAAILDALTRLAASKAAAAVETGSDEDYRQRVNTLAGRVNTHVARFERLEARLTEMSARLLKLENWMMTP